MIAQRGRLVSLLDIMKLFGPHRLLELAALLELLGTLPEVTGAGLDWRQGPVSASIKEQGTLTFSTMESDCIALGLTASVITLRKIQMLFSDSKATQGQLSALVSELQSRLSDELSGTVCLSLSAYEAEYYSNPRKGWEEIIDRFPDAVSDIEEAAKCFALSRYAASVYHSIQVVELGLLEMGPFIGVNDPRSGWTAVSDRLEQIVKTKWGNRTDFEKRNHEFLEQIRATTDVLKNAWRNKISHAQGKVVLLTSDFTPDVTEEILIATRSFMRRLAAGLGSPVG